MPTKWINYRELKDRLPFDEVLAHYGVDLNLKNSGQQHTGFCPLPGHQGQKKSPSFSANLKAKIFQCFGCGAKGNLLEFAALMQGLDPGKTDEFRTAALALAEAFPEKLTVPATKSAPPPAPKPRKDNPPEIAIESEVDQSVLVNPPLDFELKQLDPQHPYLMDRGFSKETVTHFGLGYCAKGLMGGRVAIPLHNTEGELIGYAGRLVDDGATNAVTPKYKLPGSREKGGTRIDFQKSRFLYNRHHIRGPIDDLMVVEGFPSVWWLWQQGFQHVVGLMGASCSDDQAAIIVEMVVPAGRVWLLPDGDKGGERCALDALGKIAPHRLCRWLRLPQGRQPTDLAKAELDGLLDR